MNGKGDTRRPCFVSEKQFSDNWDLAFCRHLSISIVPPAATGGEAWFTCCSCRKALGRDELRSIGGYAWGYWTTLHPEDK